MVGRLVGTGDEKKFGPSVGCGVSVGCMDGMIDTDGDAVVSSRLLLLLLLLLATLVSTRKAFVCNTSGMLRSVGRVEWSPPL